MFDNYHFFIGDSTHVYIFFPWKPICATLIILTRIYLFGLQPYAATLIFLVTRLTKIVSVSPKNKRVDIKIAQSHKMKSILMSFFQNFSIWGFIFSIFQKITESKRLFFGKAFTIVGETLIVCRQKKIVCCHAY